MITVAKNLLWTIFEVLVIAFFTAGVLLSGAFAAEALLPAEPTAREVDPIRPESIFTEAELSDQYAMRQTLNTMIYDLEVSLGYAPNYDEHEATYVLEFYSDYKCEE